MLKTKIINIIKKSRMLIPILVIVMLLTSMMYLTSRNNTSIAYSVRSNYIYFKVT